MTARTTQVYIRNRGFVLSELGDRTQRTGLIREKRALSQRASNGANDPPRDIDRGMCYAFKNFFLQVGNVVGSNKVNKVISVRFARLVPSASGNCARCVISNNIGDTQDHEFHQRLASWCAAAVYSGVIPTHDHRRRRQCAAATLQIDLREEVQRRFAKMNMRGLAGSRSGLVVDRALERDEHDKN